MFSVPSLEFSSGIFFKSESAVENELVSFAFNIYYFAFAVLTLNLAQPKSFVAYYAIHYIVKGRETIRK